VPPLSAPPAGAAHDHQALLWETLLDGRVAPRSEARRGGSLDEHHQVRSRIGHEPLELLQLSERRQCRSEVMNMISEPAAALGIHDLKARIPSEL
jgi:hypothetical protein